MRRFFILLLVIFFFLLQQNHVQAQDRYAECDLCGFCWKLTPIPPQTNPPSSWNSCIKCLYPSLYDQAQVDPKTTLKIGADGQPPQPAKGVSYTMLGCIGSNLNSFQSPGAAAGVVQALLNIIFSMVGGISFLSIIYGSFIIITSQSNPERINYGKKIVFGAIVGAVFAISAVFVVNIIASGILRIPGFSPIPSP